MPAVPLFDLLQAELSPRLAPGAETFVDLFTDDGVLECPFAPDGSMRQTTGKAAIGVYLGSLDGTLGSDGMTLSAAYHTEGGDTAILEYDSTACNVRPGTRYAQKYVALVKLRAGRIALFREYWNPLPVIDAFGSPAGFGNAARGAGA